MGPFVGGAVAGMFVGRIAIHRLPAKRVQQLFGAVTLIAAAGLARARRGYCRAPEFVATPV